MLKQFSEELSGEEQALLDKWLQQSPANRAFYNKINDEEEFRKLLLSYHLNERQASEERVLNQLFQKINGHRSEGKRKTGNMTRWLAAAAVIAIVGATVYLYVVQKRHSPTAIVAQAQDIQAPSSNRAMITLADGSNVFLDSLGNGQLVQQGNVKLVKLANGKIAYQAANAPSEGGAAVLNTLRNPRGSKVIDMQLSDGSHVWLNAGSSITYPVVFTGDERKVELKGEGYFEVAPSSSPKGGKRRPFIVTFPSPLGGGREGAVEVLGTHFNVNAYGDEPATKVTLLEGSVHVAPLFKENGSGLKLKPGQQAVVNLSTYQLISHPNLTQVMAWKNGLFEFDDADIQSVMKELARWYNIDVSYSGSRSQHFVGSIERSKPLSKVLTMLEKTGAVTFEVKGNRVIVKE
ncbi:FecR family protein [Niabella beijingensis]|uniref:FecR family protein n=1 Tax=Niabella beijingensis TaxID=2872700 RepID=UPI0023E4010C|nr:FecR family protein [Niabella beijingensis]